MSGDVLGDAVEPGRDSSLRATGTKAAVGHEKDFLDDVVDLGLRGAQVPRPSRNRLAVSREQRTDIRALFVCAPLEDGSPRIPGGANLDRPPHMNAQTAPTMKWPYGNERGRLCQPSIP